ncbi:MAG: Rieske 2Fe-2S domain-containing protein [Acidobacteriia bacterium]|nr:Rieske 2Fe-2S domain-containing protein [Terriglobia bacterium]
MTQERRSIARWLLGGGFAASAVSFLYPALKFMNPPAVPEASVNEVPAGKVQDLKPNSGKIVKFGSRPALLIRVGQTEFRAFSAICTHLNCTVQFQETTHQIWCACHNGFYDINGKVVSGPPPRPLEEYDVRLRGDDVVISKRA